MIYHIYTMGSTPDGTQPLPKPIMTYGLSDKILTKTSEFIFNALDINHRINLQMKIMYVRLQSLSHWSIGNCLGT